MPVLEAHNIVEDWVDGSTEVVEEAGHVEKVLIEGAIDLGVLEVDIAKPLCKEGIRLVSFRKQNFVWKKLKYFC